MTVETMRRVCQWEGCNTVFDCPVTGDRPYCRKHQRSNYQPVERETGKRRAMPPKNPWTVVSNPAGDFVGAAFAQLDFFVTVWMGSFEPGTVARYTGFTSRELKDGHLAPAQLEKVKEIRRVLSQWEGYISYLHTPDWSMERTTAELRKLYNEGHCDAVVLDYLEKVGTSKRQIQMYGSNLYHREADNVEQLKNFAESTGIPVLMVAQMNKEGKKEDADTMDRTAMRGAGEKSEKANVVILLHRKRIGEGYSNEVNGMIDKNTMGATGTFKQVMQPEFYRVGDPIQRKE